ncbi:MAG: hypothetical protein KJ879_01905 [Nanoarchaeota archaeon]|nr:hypothetical protein [Nanoarchaeota archaeon]
MEKPKIRFRDLSGWLKAIVMLGWISILGFLLKEEILDSNDVKLIFWGTVIYFVIKDFDKIKEWWRKQKVWEKAIIMLFCVVVLVWILIILFGD